MPPARALPTTPIGWQCIYQWPILRTLRAKDDSSSLQIDSEMAGEVEAAGEPMTCRNVELRPTVDLPKACHGSLEGAGVEGEAIADASVVGDGCSVGACGRIAMRIRQAGRAHDLYIARIDDIGFLRAGEGVLPVVMAEGKEEDQESKGCQNSKASG